MAEMNRERDNKGIGSRLSPKISSAPLYAADK
jgi:hypothetical protein